jgi:hypothetical protein
LTDICKLSVEDAVSSFRELCSSAVEDATGYPVSQSTPFLLQSSALPDFSQYGLVAPLSNASLTKYKSELRQRISGQSPDIQETLQPLNKCARALRENISPATDVDEDTQLVQLRAYNVASPNCCAGK